MADIAQNEGITDSDIEDELDFSKLPYLMEEMTEEQQEIAETDPEAEDEAEFIRRVMTRTLDLKTEFVKIDVLTLFTKSW
jgi:hypothetical protein